MQPSNDPALRILAIPPWLTGGLTAIGLICAVAAAFVTPSSSLPLAAKCFMLAWLTISVAVTLLLTPRNFTAGFLIGLFAMMAGWRIAGLDGVSSVSYSLIPAFIAFVLQFFQFARNNMGRGYAAWHLTLIRLYVGFDMIPHFTEKLFAGPGPFIDDVHAFAGFGLPAPAAFVILGGFCELGTAIGIGLGLFTRLAAAGATLYFLIATLSGGHFDLGFIWASPGGGWEYPVLMMVLFLSFVIRGGGDFSLDRVLEDAGWLPKRLRLLAIPEGATSHQQTLI